MSEPTKDMPEWERQLRVCVANIPAYTNGREIAAALAEIDRLRAENIDLERRVMELTAQAAALARLNCQITDGDMNLQRLAAVTAERDSWRKCHDEMSDSYARGVLERERLAAGRELLAELSLLRKVRDVAKVVAGACSWWTCPEITKLHEALAAAEKPTETKP